MSKPHDSTYPNIFFYQRLTAAQIKAAQEHTGPVRHICISCLKAEADPVHKRCGSCHANHTSQKRG